MKAVIRWAIANSPAMNTIMVVFLLIGAASMYILRREEFPEFELEVILVSVPYPGASPEEVENGICQKIEEAVRSIDGIKTQTTVAKEGSGSVVLELEANIRDAQKILNQVRSEVDRIPSFPELAEDAEIQQITMRRPAIKVGITGPDLSTPESELELRAVCEQVRDDLLQLPSVSQTSIEGARPYQIDIEIPEETLRKHGLTLRGVAQTVRRENIELPGGNLKTQAADVLLRGKNKRLTGREIAKIPLVTRPNGAKLTVGELGVVKDEFADTTSISRINNMPGMVVSVNAAAREDLLKMTEETRDFVAKRRLPDGYQFVVWGDRSVNVRDRIDLLRRNGLQGLCLVFLVLAIFLEIRLAWWVAMGIPISVLGACTVLLYMGETMNMLSMFSFLMALGIVVDDAIVIGENIYSHRESGKKLATAAVDGTYEVLPSVTASVTTTIFAFMPMLFVTGMMGKFFAVMPAAMIAMLLISLVESMLILPCHLGHEVRIPRTIRFAFGYLFLPFVAVEWVTRRINWLSDSGLRHLRDSFYIPTLRMALRQPLIVVAIAIGAFIISIGAVRSGMTPWRFFPQLDGNQIQANLTFPNGTPSRFTDEATKRAEAAILALNEQAIAETGKPITRIIHRMVGQGGQAGGPGGGAQAVASGSHIGTVSVELVASEDRNDSSQQIIEQWRKETGKIVGVDSALFQSVSMGPGGKAIEFKLLASGDNIEQLEAAVEACKEKLASYAGVYDIDDDSRPGKWEFQLRVKEKAQNMGIPLSEVAQTVRSSYYGEEVMRLQRGRHEVKLMVRYPGSQRRSLAGFDGIRIRGNDGAERPLTELVEVSAKRGYAEINRVDQMRSITVFASVDEATARGEQITGLFKTEFVPELVRMYPDIKIRWEGQAQQRQESIQSLFIGFAVALMAMYVLLTVEFQSYIQPMIILFIIPFGAVGAIWGHVLMDLPITLFSILGFVALTGVVVNDSIVLMDFINARQETHSTIFEALVEAGQKRLRPVLLTSITTIAGLLPILTETSLQAQLVIPMATSLCFGLLLATFLVLYLIPIFYLIYNGLCRLLFSSGAPPQVDLKKA